MKFLYCLAITLLALLPLQVQAAEATKPAAKPAPAQTKSDEPDEKMESEEDVRSGEVTDKTEDDDKEPEPQEKTVHEQPERGLPLDKEHRVKIGD